MTVIVAIVEDGDVLLGMDSCATEWNRLYDLADKEPLSFPIPAHPPLLLGCAGLHAIPSEIVSAWTPPQPADDDALGFLRACAASLRALLTAEPVWRLVRTGEGREVDGRFIACWRGRMVEIDGNFGMAVPRSGETAVGSGAAYALGALTVTRGRSARERVHAALTAAAEFDAGVAPPFTLRWAGR